MKLIPFLALFVLFCSANAYVAYLAEYEASLKAWNELRPSTYTFVAYDQNQLYDYNLYTAITVADGEVVKRVYTVPDNIIENAGGVGAYTWTEDTPDTIGTHGEGFIPITLDDIYKQCRDNVLVNDNMANPVVFTTDERGLLRQCYSNWAYTSHSAKIGIQITSIEL